MTKRIFIVDDSPVIIQLLKNALKNEYIVYATPNSLDAFRVVTEFPYPDLIILDVMMPKMDGYAVCQQLKADDRTKDIPVIFLTGLNEIADEVKGFSYGAVDFVVKPIVPEIVRARVKTHLELKHHRDHLEMLIEERTSELQNRERQYNSIVENVEGLIFTTERDTRIDFMNKGLREYTGTADLGEHCYKALFGYDERCPWCAADELKKGQTIKREVQNPRDNKWYYEIITPLNCQNGKVTRKQVTLIDITDRKNKENQLELKAKQLREENIHLRSNMKKRKRFGDIIGKSHAMQIVYESIINAAKTDSNVLIQGESGTGKELVAKAIHNLSSQRNNDYVTVNCGAIPLQLMESEFFGYKKGAFTGADKDKTGFLDRANGGTLFLDELGELDVNIQIKLLRAIEGGGYSAVGDTGVSKSEFRIISATNRSLKEAITAGKFRSDFFYRINVIQINLPPLRDRKDDIPILIEHFLVKYGQQKKYKEIADNSMDLLMKYNWPGNIRELENAIQQFISMNTFNFLESDIEDLQVESDMANPDGQVKDLNTMVKSFEAKIIRQILERNRWHRGKTAEELKITRRTLERKMKSYQIR